MSRRTRSALLLAAGRGERMRPYTDHTPKPLLRVAGKPLIEWHLEALARAGIRNVVINTAWLGEQFEPALGDGRRWGLRIRYSHERAQYGQALETAGALAAARHLFEQEEVWVIAGDVWAPSLPLDMAHEQALRGSRDLVRLFLVPNPPHNVDGDFRLDAQGRLQRKGGAGQAKTYAAVGLVKLELVEGLPAGQRMPLRPCIEFAIDNFRAAGVAYDGDWVDVGTPERLMALNAACAPA